MATKKKKEDSKKAEAVEGLVDRLNSRFGEGTIVGGKDISGEIEVVSTGSLTLDLATGIGGNPVGRLIEIFGPESTGKSTLALHFIAEFQKAGKKCLLQDNEQSFDKNYATNIGVKVDELLVTQSRSQEEGYNVIEEVVRSGEVGLIIIDSHTAMVPKRVVDGEIGEATMGIRAKINSEALNKIHPLLRKNNCTILAIAQLRADIGAYGDPLKPTGGYAYKFYSDMRYKVSKVVDKDNSLNKTVVEVVKNKCAIPFGKGEFAIQWGKGIDRDKEIIQLAADNHIITRGGAGWYTLPDGTKAQGDEAIKKIFNDNPEFRAEIEQKVIEIVKNQ